MALPRYFPLLLITAGVLLPGVSHAQFGEIPDCSIAPEDPFCQGQCAIDPELPWCEQPEPTGNSSVAFIPGFQGSRLYRQGAAGEDQLWVPTRNQDAEQLFLDDSGESIDPAIYTRDIIDESFLSLNIYHSFIEFMDNDMVGTGIINAWRAVPYDWRFAADDLANLPEMTETLVELAAASDNGKVTIVTHSNGGLVAKALLAKLAQQKQAGESDLIDRIDRLIMIAAPQLGTPKALAGLLHGDGQNLAGGFLVHKDTARELAENMPGAYGLLPSAEYFNTVADPPIRFTSEVANNYNFRSIYGEAIDTFTELTQFLTGDNGARHEPAADDTDAPNVLNAALLNEAGDLHANTLDNWTPSENLEVIQVAGWGLDTIYAIEYDDCDFCPFGQDLSNLDREVLKTFDGDGTVVTASGTASNFTSYFMNLRTHNRGLVRNRDHASITEADPLRSLVQKLIENDLSDLPEHISSAPPDDSNINGHRLRLKSPVNIHIYDTGGRHTGLIDNPDPDSDLKLYEEQIPNSSYLELGEKKYLSLDGDDTYTIKLSGEGTGTFTLEVDEVQGNDVTETIAYTNIPTTPALTGELTLPPEATEPALQLDLEGDGEYDATVPANESLAPAASLDLLKQAIRDTDMHHLTKSILLVRVTVIERLLQRNLTRPADRALRDLDRSIEHMTGKQRGITQEEALPLREIIAAIRETL